MKTETPREESDNGRKRHEVRKRARPAAHSEIIASGAMRDEGRESRRETEMHARELK